MSKRAGSALLLPVDIASIVYFRIALGVMLVWEVWRYMEADWIARYYIEPMFHFTYFGFEWVRPLPGPMMYAFFVAMMVLAAAFALGYRYRVVAPLVFMGVSYWFLLETARYLNHFYLIILFAFVMMFVPANQALSMDVAAGRVSRSDFAPTWTLWLVRFQMGVVYFFGGIAKLGGDWLAGAPMADWLAARDDFPIIGPWFHDEWMVRLFVTGGLFFDLLIVPALLWRRTRWPAFAAVILFHSMNDVLWNIGVFPWLAIHASTIFFAPDWPRRLLAKVGVVTTAGAHGLLAPIRFPAPKTYIIVIVAALVAFNVTMPIRHHAYEGDVNWTDEGHRWSWRMKLRDKDAEVAFWVTDPVRNETFEIDARDRLESWQESAMEGRPDMIHQYAIYLAKTIEAGRGHPVEVRVDAMASLHGRPAQWLIDPTVDIGAIPRGIGQRDWIVPLEHPLPDPFADR